VAEVLSNGATRRVRRFGVPSMDVAEAGLLDDGGKLRVCSEVLYVCVVPSMDVAESCGGKLCVYGDDDDDGMGSVDMHAYADDDDAEAA
jgi:hypothetical protein